MNKIINNFEFANAFLYFCETMAEKQYISLLELQKLIKCSVEDAMPLSYWITAEISELKVNYSGHCYLELVEKGGANQVPRARASAVVWRSTFGTLGSYFRSATGSDLAEGMNVLMKVSVCYHELYGLSLSVSDIDPLYTLGDMERQRQETIRRLTDEGVFDMNRSLDLPPVIQRIAVVSSRNAAGYQDFMNELAAGGYFFRVELFDAAMQGHGAEEAVINALENVAANAERFDIVVIIRGGGSQSDLAAFDSYRLCCHVAQFPLPVVAGIGHDKDQSVADLVAAVSLKTPTAVAAWLVAGLAELDGWLGELSGEVVRAAVAILDGEKRRLQTAGSVLSRTASAMTHGLDMRLERLAGELRRRQGNILTTDENTLNNLARSLRERIAARFTRENMRIEMAQRMADSRRPDNILSLGFAIVRHGGAALKNSNNVKAGDRLDITLVKGTIIANVNSTE